MVVTNQKLTPAFEVFNASIHFWQYLAISLALLPTMLCSALSLAEDNKKMTEHGTIQVVGHGKAHQSPDTVSFTIGIKVSSRDYQEAMKEAKTKIAKIIDISKKFGLEASDIQSEYVNLRASTRSGVAIGRHGKPDETSDYIATSEVRITLRKLDAYEQLTNAFIAQGANNLHSLKFSSSKQNAMRRTARKKALEDATTKATEIANQMQLKLGEAIQIIEGAQPYYRPLGRSALMMHQSSSPEMLSHGSPESLNDSLAPGQLTAVDAITVIFTTKPKN